MRSRDREVLQAQIEALDRLTDAKFVTYRALIDSQAEKVALALTAAEKAITKAETATEKRFESVNEFRATLSDQASDFVTRVEFQSLKERMDETKGKSLGMNSAVAVLVQIVVIGIAVAAILIGN